MRSNRAHTILSCVAVLVSFTFSSPMAKKIKSVERTIQGFNCVSIGTTCSVDKIDAQVASEKAFVRFKAGGRHYLIGNPDRALLGRPVTKMVRIGGHLSYHVDAIFADSLEIKNGEKWKRSGLWSGNKIRCVVPFHF